MRITQDKNGEPFGFSEKCCEVQMRIGGKKQRVAKFLERFPWAAGKPAEPVPVPDPVAAAKPVTGTVTAPEPKDPPKPKPKSSMANPFDFLLQQGKTA